ncbi:thiamine kinase [Pseudocitrobacter cyperus]|uniref:Thiamine kinase n=1 Tax=Pseudocitrobacter cyperus TaxID=3112843 RepID=A0ABV0HG63_9ENTR
MPLRNNKLTRDDILSRYFPHYRIVASPGFSGLSGSSCVIAHGEQRRVLRQHHTAQLPEFHFLRQYHALSRLPARLAPKPLFYTPGWMLVEFLAGEVKSVLPPPRQLASLLYYLHQQPRFGWRISLLPLLEGYWAQCDPARRTPFWLRVLRRLRAQGEPQPLRLAPLHMDVHAGNIVHTRSGLRLIDWEYAGDGDIALELASVWMADAQQRRNLSDAYAQCANIAPAMLWQHILRWRPWVLMLMAGWYECRWQQTGDKQFITQADATWCQLKEKR